MPLWRVITGLGITQIIGWGSTYYALGALSGDIAAAEGWSKTLIFGAFSLALLLSGAISRRAGRAIDEYGGRRAMAAGSLLSAVGCLILGLSSHPVTYIAGWLVLGVAMKFVLYDAAFAALAQVAGSGARRAISYLTLFGGFASTVFWPLSHLLSKSFGWNAAFLVYAILHLAVCLPIHFAVLTDKKGMTDAGSTSAIEPDPLDGRQRLTAVVLFAAAVALNGLVFSAVSSNVVPLFEGLGYSAAAAVTLAALIGPAQVASRVGEIALGRRLKASHLGIIAFSLLPLALLIFIAGGFSWGAALVFAVLYGMSNGLVTIARGAVPLSLFGHAGYGAMLGTIAAPNLVLNAVAPLLFAILLDHGGARTGLAVAFAFALLSVGGMLVLARLHPR